MAEPIQSIDREARDKALALLNEYLAGLVTSGQLDRRWPKSSRDAALGGVMDFIAILPRGYLREAFKETFTAEGVSAVFERCQAFLASGAAYEYDEWALNSLSPFGHFEWSMVIVGGLGMLAISILSDGNWLWMAGGGLVFLAAIVVKVCRDSPAERAMVLQWLIDGEGRHWPSRPA